MFQSRHLLDFYSSIHVHISGPVKFKNDLSKGTKEKLVRALMSFRIWFFVYTPLIYPLSAQFIIASNERETRPYSTPHHPKWSLIFLE